MAESSLSITRAELLRAVGRLRGYGPDPDEWTGANQYKADEVNDCIKFGLARVYSAHDWRFLRPSLELAINAPYSTGTASATGGVAYISGGTFPSWSTQADLVHGGVYYRIASVISSHYANLTEAAGLQFDTYSIVQRRVSLPDDFAALIGDLHYRPGGSLNSSRIKIVDDETIRRMAYQYPASDYPRFASIVPRSSDGSDGQRFELNLYPFSSAAARLVGRYRVNPNALSEEAEYPYGGMTIGPLILAACLAEAERMDEINDGRHERRYQEAFESSKKRDAEMTAAQTVGFDLGTGPCDSFPADRFISERFDPNSLDL